MWKCNKCFSEVELKQTHIQNHQIMKNGMVNVLENKKEIYKKELVCSCSAVNCEEIEFMSEIAEWVD